MADALIQEGVSFHSVLRQKLDNNIDRLSQIRKFSTNCFGLFSNFSKDITNSCRSFFLKLKNDEEQDQSIIFLSKYIIDIMSQLSRKVQGISKKIQNQVIDPLSQFVQNQATSNRIALRESQQLIYSLQANNDFLKQLSKNFDMRSKQNISLNQKEQFRMIYQMEMEKCNEKWNQLKKKYQNVLTKIDSSNSSRCNFTLKMQLIMIKQINKLVNSSTVQESLQDYEDFNCDNNSLSLLLKQQIRDKYGRSILFEERPNQIEQNEVLCSSQHKKMIDDFVSIFTSRSNIKQQSKDYEQARALILDKIQWIQYFLSKMQNSLHTEIHLPIVKYRELTALLKFIFAFAAEIKDNFYILYNILYVSYRIAHGDQYLIKELGKYDDYWKNNQIWFGIMQYIKSSRFSYKKMEDSNKHKYHRLMGIFNKQNWNYGKSKVSTEKRIKSQKLLLDARDYDIMCEINYYMARLQLQQKFIFDFIFQANTLYGLSQDNITKLLKYHYFNKINNTNKLGATYLKRKKRLQKKYKQITSKADLVGLCVGKSMAFLSLTDNPWQLLLVCKSWSKNLKKRVYSRYLILQKNISQKNRLKIYKSICTPPFSREVYQRMVKQIPQYTEHSQIIFLDAKRSLSWDESLRIIMMQVLRTYAFYHPDVGYLQGMNYLCQNILKLTDDNYIIYSIFEHLMNNHYYGMYIGKFDGLKIKIYQMMRIIQRESITLYNHFEAQKLEGQHFLLSWAITLWGEMTGQLSWILWDGFLVKGWKWFFKTNLWLLRYLQGQLLKMNFQEMMSCFSDLGNSLFCLDLTELGSFGIDKLKIKEEIEKIQIQEQVLKDIQKQYMMKVSTMNQLLQKFDKKKKK